MAENCVIRSKCSRVVRVDEAANLGVVVAAVQAIQSQLAVVVVTISQGSAAGYAAFISCITFVEPKRFHAIVEEYTVFAGAKTVILLRI